MGIIDIVKRGIGYMKLAFEKETITEKVIETLIMEHRNSTRVEWMRTGARYYEVDNDYRKKNTGLKKEYQADTKLSHPTYKNIIDEKIGFLFSKDVSIYTKNDKTTELIISHLGEDINYDLESLGLEASNKGIAWLHPFINAQGEFKLFIPSSEQIIPGWTDSTHTELNYVIRYYDDKVFRFNRFETITNVEFWTKDEVTYYRLENGRLINKKVEGHFNANGQVSGWGVVPWIPFKNNRKEMPDIKAIKSLIDDYDLSRSEVSNYIQEVTNMIFVLKGYSGASLDEFLEHIYKKRVVILDADEDSEASTLNPQMDINAAKEHYEQIKNDILEGGQAINRNLDKFGSAPSGVALDFLFNALEIKGNQLISEFSRGFKRLVEFIYLYLDKTNTSVAKEKVRIVFNTDMIKDESSIIDNCNKSLGVVSVDTILANHPWVADINAEKEKLAKESFDSVELEENEE